MLLIKATSLVPMPRRQITRISSLQNVFHACQDAGPGFDINLGRWQIFNSRSRSRMSAARGPELASHQSSRYLLSCFDRVRLIGVSLKWVNNSAIVAPGRISLPISRTAPCCQLIFRQSNSAHTPKSRLHGLCLLSRSNRRILLPIPYDCATSMPLCRFHVTPCLYHPRREDLALLML